MTESRNRSDAASTPPQTGDAPARVETPSPQRTISPGQFAVFGFGGIVGTAWVLLLGGFLLHAGPAGALLGIALGGGAMALIAAMYAELASRFPQTGGEVTFITAVFGKRAGFVVGWLLTLAYLSNLVFEGVALEWLAETLWPTLADPVLYHIFGQAVGAGGLVLALGSGLTIAVLNIRGARSFVKFQNALTILFLLMVLLAVAAELHHGSAGNMRPFWRSGTGQSWLFGASWVFGSAPMIFNGFQGVLHTIEERSPSTSKETVVKLSVATVAGAMVFYLLVVVAAVQATPWIALASSDLPAVNALSGLPWSAALRTIFLLALIASLLKAWNSVFMTAVRLLFAQAREGMLPAFFASVDPRTGMPGRAVVAVAVVNLVGILLGKGLLEPIVNIMSVCIASIFAMICVATLTIRSRHPAHAGFRVRGGHAPGLVAVASALGMVGFALLQPAPAHQAGLFKWALLLIWAMIGVCLYRIRNRRSTPMHGDAFP